MTTARAILAVVIFCVMIMLLLYGMIAEVELRQLKADRRAYNRILTDRALLEHQADKEALSKEALSSKEDQEKQFLTAISYQLSAGEGNEP